MFLWMMLMPPSWAIATASRDSLDGVHRRRTIGGDPQVAGQAGFEGDVLRQDGRMRGDEGNIVVRQCFSLDAEHRQSGRGGGSASLWPRGPSGGPRRHARAAAPSASSAASRVFCIKVATVIGPTPPGTGVIQLASRRGIELRRRSAVRRPGG